MTIDPNSISKSTFKDVFMELEVGKWEIESCKIKLDFGT